MFNKWIELGLKKGFSDVEVFSTRSKSLSIEVYQGKVVNLTTSDVEKAKVRAVYDEKMVSSLENILSPEEWGFFNSTPTDDELGLDDDDEIPF